MDAASIDAAVAAEIAKRPPADAIELAEGDEGRAASIFLALDTQWNWTTTGMVAGNGGFAVQTGLKYEVIAPTALALDIAVDRQVMLDIRIMEAEALKTLAEARR